MQPAPFAVRMRYRVLPGACLLFARSLLAQQVELPPAAVHSGSTQAAALAQLARATIAVYADTDRERYRDNLARLQAIAGEPAAASQIFETMRVERTAAKRPGPAASVVPYEVYAHALVLESSRNVSFPAAFAASYRDVVGSASGISAAYAIPWAFGTSVTRLERGLADAMTRLQGHQAIPVGDAIDLVRRYLSATAYRSFQPLLDSAQAADDDRRYIVDRDVLVPTGDGAHICVLVMRPRNVARAPALLNFSIYANSDHVDEARLSAAHGYTGVSALTRGKACSPDKPVPFEHDGTDAAAVIDWIARQTWSDGRVGMFGGSYDGFTQWAAAKHHPKALKAIMPSVAADPGLGFPMEGGVFMTYAYPYPFYVTDTKELDDNTYYDSERWARLTRTWYLSGRAYASLDSIDGTPNPVFDRWLSHPDYDAYWQHMMPFGHEFADIHIPVLTTTGYYDSGQEGATYFAMQQMQRDPSAQHYLVIGPYDHVRGQRGTISPLGSPMTELRGYALDPAAQIEIPNGLRYEWFDYLFKGGAKPALLKDRINYEVMGADAWKHAPSVAAMASRTWNLHLNADHSLSEATPARSAAATQVVDLADRSDADHGATDQALDNWAIIDSTANLANSIEFASAPLDAPTEITGLFSASLDLVTNKKDFDLSVTLFEKTAQGKYFQLSYVWMRASYAGGFTRRRLLAPNVPQHLSIISRRLTSRLLARGSRLVVVLSVIKQPGEEINYGSGKAVSTETISDAGAPLRIEWRNSSIVRVPVGG